MKSKLLKGIVVCAALVLSGCVAPIANIASTPINATRQASLKDVESAILEAGKVNGWTMKTVRPGLIVGTLAVRAHLAVVDITFDANAFSIQYKDSSNLKYDGTNIHSNYNSWVQSLSTRIRANLAVL